MPVVSNDGEQDAANQDAMNGPAIPVQANTSVPPFIAAPASSVAVENATAVIPAPVVQVNTGAEVKMDADDIASAPTFGDEGMQPTAVNDEQH